MRKWIFGFCLLGIAAAAAAQENVQLKEAPGKDVVIRNCQTCHSLDYIIMNSPFLDRKGWEASVNKMIKTMGAPIPDDQVASIVDYLATNYGKQ